EQMRQNFTLLQGAGFLRSTFSPVLGEAYSKAQRYEDGLTLLTEALATADRMQFRMLEAELYRLKGELTQQEESKKQGAGAGQRAGSREQEVEGYFLKAISIARKQQAKSLELRAVMSLSRLWQQQGKKEEAQQLLAETYGWFTEGFDTQDLQEAKA